MTLVDARTLDAATLPPADVCIIGAGAAGITLALQLERLGKDVVLIESGDLAPEAATQDLAELENAGYPVRENFMSRARYFGGSCNLWAGRSMHFSAEDLGAREWVEGSAWPLPYAELAAHYPAAAKVLRLPDPARFDAATWTSRWSGEEARLFEAPLRPTISLWATSPKRFARDHRRALKRSRRIRVLLRANAMELRTREADTTGATPATGETTGDTTRVRSLAVGTLEGARFDVRARTFVLACGGIENARLLLVSRDAVSSGLGNANDLVGRYFMDHPRAVYGSLVMEGPARFPLLRSQPLRDGKVQFGLRLDADTQRREGLLNHYVTFEKKVSGYAEASYQSFVQTMKVVLRRGYAGKRSDLFKKAKFGNIPGMVYLLTPKELLPHAVWRYGTKLRNAVRKPPEREERIVVYFCEQPPDRDSRVMLSAARDALGMPRTVLDWRVGNDVHESVRRLQAVLARELEARGVGRLTPGEGDPRYTDASHHMGTTRMGTHAATGVVDTDAKVFGVENLYVASSSVFPSVGHQNPTFTMLALTLRMAQHLGAN